MRQQGILHNPIALYNSYNYQEDTMININSKHRITGVRLGKNILITLVLAGLCLAGCTRKLETRYDNGQLKEKYAVKKDAEGNYIKQGIYESWYENGQKKQKGTFKDDK